MQYKIPAYYSQEKKVNKILFARPRRSKKKEFIQIENKTVPLHFIAINRSYQGQLSSLACFSKWAYIPTNSAKEAKESPQIKKQKSSSAGILNKTTSSLTETFYKKYLKRKERIASRDRLYLSYSGIIHQGKKGYRITSDNFYLQDYIDLNQGTKVSSTKANFVTDYNRNKRIATEQSPAIFKRYTFKEHCRLNQTTKKQKITRHFFNHTIKEQGNSIDQ